VPRKYSVETRSEEAALRRQRLIDAAVKVLGEVGADLLYDMYERQGAVLTTMLELDEPAIRAQVRDMRTWRQDRLEQILRSSNETLRQSQTVSVSERRCSGRTLCRASSAAGAGEASTERSGTGCGAAPTPRACDEGSW
jgi:hypothetical protein